MTGWMIGAAILAVIALTAWREARAEERRQRARMYHGRRPAPSIVDAARLDYFARTAPTDEIAAMARRLETLELDRAAARVVAEMAAEADAQSNPNQQENP